MDDEDKFYISDRHRFISVSELIHYHQHNSGGLVTRLRQPPLFGKKPSTAGFGHGKFRGVTKEGGDTSHHQKSYDYSV